MGYSNYIEVKTRRADGTTRVQEFRGPNAVRDAHAVPVERGRVIQGYSEDGRTIDDLGGDH